MRNVRLALLVCDELTPGVVAEHGDYAQIFHQFLSSSLAPIASESAEVTFTLEAFDVVKDMVYPADDIEYDGILISGSRASAYDEEEWIKKLIAYVKRIIASKPSSKVFGVCFGHQIIATALGFSVKRGDLEASVRTIQLTSIGRAIFQTNTLDLQLMHRDEVTTSLPEAHLLGSTVMALNQGIAVFNHGEAPVRTDPHTNALRVPLTSIHVLSLQAHPEFSELIMRTIIAEFCDKLGWSPEFVEETLSRVGMPTGAIDKVGRAIWGMFGVTPEC